MQEISFEEAVDLILAGDPRYHRDAYGFIREALDFTQKLVDKAAPNPPRHPGTGEKEHHVSGQELLEGIRQFALVSSGPMAITVLEEWGVTNCRDFGSLVFNMIDVRLLSKNKSDSLDDFAGGYDFYDAFRKPYLPASRLAAAPTEPKPAKA